MATDELPEPTAHELAEAQRRTREQWAREEQAHAVRRLALVGGAAKPSKPEPEDAAALAERLRVQEAARQEEQIEGARFDRERRDAEWTEQAPPKFKAARLDALDKRVAADVGDWLMNLGTGASLILSGPAGTGKTFAAYAVARHHFVHVVRGGVMFRSLAKLLDEIRPGPNSEKAFTEAQTKALLVLDDWGVERKTDWTDERLHIVVDERWQWQRPLVVTTNVDPMDLPEAFGERLFSRVAQGATIITFDGSDRRGRS